MRLANEICAAAMEHVRGELRPGMKESEAAALWLGYVHGEGTGWHGQGRARARLLARLVGRRHQDVHGDRRPAGAGGRSRRCSRSGSAPTATGATTRSCSARASCAPTTASSRPGCSTSTGARSTHCRPGASLAELDRLVRDGIAAIGYPGPADAPDLPRRRRARPRAAVRAPGRRRRDRRGDGARDRAGLLLGRRRRPARRGQLPDHERGRREALALPGRSGAMPDVTR